MKSETLLQKIWRLHSTKIMICFAIAIVLGYLIITTITYRPPEIIIAMIGPFEVRDSELVTYSLEDLNLKNNEVNIAQLGGIIDYIQPVKAATLLGDAGIDVYIISKDSAKESEKFEAFGNIVKYTGNAQNNRLRLKDGILYSNVEAYLYVGKTPSNEANIARVLEMLSN